MRQNEKNEIVTQYEQFLNTEEKSNATIEKYLRDIRKFMIFLKDRELCKEETIAYKKYLTEKYAAASVNSMLVALNGFLGYMGRQECCVKLLKIQRKIFENEERELTKAEYVRLLDAAKDSKIALIMRTICSTGIRVSELKNITVEAAQEGKSVIRCKNKTRVIFIPKKLQKMLKNYAKKQQITSGTIFVTKDGNPMNRSNVWKMMKQLCDKAKVAKQKVFPHNLRHLFARTFYTLENDIVRLADVLGHNNINTTRIYTIETGDKHRRILERVENILAT